MTADNIVGLDHLGAAGRSTWSRHCCSPRGSDVRRQLAPAHRLHRGGRRHRLPARHYMAKVYGDGEKAPGDRVFRPDRARDLPRLRRRPEERAALDDLRVLAARRSASSSFLVLYALQRLQGHLPLNPDRRAAASCPHLSFNTAVSFLTNTNWQNYAGESTMWHLTQMAGLAVQNFVSAAAGMAVAGRADPRPRRAGGRTTLGNFWVDLIRTTTRILLPLAFVVRARAREPGRDPELPRLHDASRPSRAQTQTDPGRPDREPGCDQAARQERRRLLQRELRAPVREPERRSRTSSRSG